MFPEDNREYSLFCGIYFLNLLTICSQSLNFPPNSDTTFYVTHASLLNSIDSEAGSPWENGYIESFYCKFRDELLNCEIFETLFEAKVLIERWRKEYNALRPHCALGYLPPAPETVESIQTVSTTLQNSVCINLSSNIKGGTNNGSWSIASVYLTVRQALREYAENFIIIIFLIEDKPWMIRH